MSVYSNMKQGLQIQSSEEKIHNKLIINRSKISAILPNNYFKID